MTPADVLVILDLSPTMSGARAVVELSRRDFDEATAVRLYRGIAGEAAPIPNRINAVLGYLAYDAALGKDTDVAGCVARAAKLEGYNFSEAARSEREATRMARAEKVAAKAAAKAEVVAKPLVTVNDDGTLTRKRGRPPAGVKSVYEQVKELYVAAVDKSKETMLPALQAALGLNAGTAQTYWYKAKKELAS